MASTPSARPQAAARRLTADTTVRTKSGASLQLPTGWWLTEADGTVLIEDPDRALKAWFVETPEADLGRAIAASWRRVAPGLGFEDGGTTDTPPPTGGWDAITTASYDTESERAAEAVARRHGNVTFVVLTEGDRAATSRRGAQLEQARSSWKPAGLREESFDGRAARSLDAANVKALDAFIAEALARLEVPGAAVAVVHGDAVVYEGVFGVRALGKKQPVTAQTLFMIGSITKPMTTMMQAALVDAGVADWKSPLVSLLPSFALGDAELTKKVELWHMSCACTGMPRSDLENIFEFADVTPEQRVAQMKTMKPTTALGETFQYSNLMVAAGGYAAARAFAPKASLGDAYDAAMRHKVFEPIGMKATTLDFAVALRNEYALPHATGIDGVVRAIPVAMERNVLPIRPAGGVWSNVRDMERYVRTEMAGGVSPDGKRVVSEANLKERRNVRTGDADTGGYGLGIGVGKYHGLAMLSHDGGALGYGTSMFILPEQKIAIIVLTNVRNGAPTEHLPFNAVVKRRVVEVLYADAKPLAATQLAYFADGKAKAAAQSARSVERTLDPARMKALAGTYTNPTLGPLKLEITKDGALLDAGEWKGAVGRPAGDPGPKTLVFLDPPFAGAEFTIGGDDASPTITVTQEQTRFVFVRAPAP